MELRPQKVKTVQIFMIKNKNITKIRFICFWEKFVKTVFFLMRFGSLKSCFCFTVNIRNVQLLWREIITDKFSHFLNGVWFSSSLLSLCCGASWCVTTSSGFKIIFGSGTRLIVESSESWFWLLIIYTWSNVKTVCAATKI